MARKGAPSNALERSPAKLERDAERARLAAMAEAEDPGEETPPDDPPETPPDEPPADPPPDDPPASDPPAEPPPKADSGKPDPEPPSGEKHYWAALRAQDERTKAALAERERKDEERWNAMMARLEKATTPKPDPVEEDPEVEAWNNAFKETADKFISPEVKALKAQQYMDRMEGSIEIAGIKHSDFDTLVGDIHDANNPLAQYLATNEDEAKKVYGAKNIGEALYLKAKFLKDATPEARESWRQSERQKLLDEMALEREKMKAELMAELKGVVAKGRREQPKPASMHSLPGGTGGVNGPMTDAQLKNMNRKELAELVRRGEAGEEIN